MKPKQEKQSRDQKRHEKKKTRMRDRNAAPICKTGKQNRKRKHVTGIQNQSGKHKS